MGYLNIDEMLSEMSQRQLLGWQRYWDAEPWGSWRDNMHAAIIAREVRRPNVRPGTSIKIEQFMVIDPEQRNRDGTVGFVSFLRAVSKPVKRGEYKHDRSRKTRSHTGSADGAVPPKAGGGAEKA